MFAHQKDLFQHPPSTDRGGKSPDSLPERIHGIDWLSYSFGGHKIPEVMQAIRECLFDESLGEASIPSPSYRSAVKFDCGAKLSWSEGRLDAHLLLTGSACTNLGIGLLVNFIERMTSIGKCCRIDLNVDVSRNSAIDPSIMDKWRENGYAVGYKRFQQHADYGKREGTGYTFAAGSRGNNGGGRHFRCYRKAINSKEQNYVRYEVEFSKERAEIAAGEISRIPHDGLQGAISYIESTVFGSIDFKEKGDTRHTGRRKTLEAWKKFVDRIRTNRIKPGRRIKSVNRTREAFLQQYSGFLYKCSKDNLNDYLSLLFEAGQLGKEKFERKQKISAQHRAELRLYAHDVAVVRAQLVEKVLLENGHDPNCVSEWMREALADSLMKPR